MIEKFGSVEFFIKEGKPRMIIKEFFIDNEKPDEDVDTKFYKWIDDGNDIILKILKRGEK